MAGAARWKGTEMGREDLSRSQRSWDGTSLWQSRHIPLCPASGRRGDASPVWGLWGGPLGAAIAAVDPALQWPIPHH